MTEEPLFRSTHEALKFAFGYMDHQSPSTPLMQMIVSSGDRLPIGNDKGLIGLDAAAQAGMILAEVCRLSDDQHNVIVARYYRSMHECLCCGQDAPREEWKAAIDALSHCVELEGVHRTVRRMMVEKAICGGRLDIEMMGKRYSLSKSATYRQLTDIKTKFRKIERIAMINLDNAFMDNGVLVA